MPQIIILPHAELCPEGQVFEAPEGQTILDAAKHIEKKEIKVEAKKIVKKEVNNLSKKVEKKIVSKPKSN